MLTRRWLPIFLCINILLLAFYLLVDYQLMFHSDSAVKNLLAQEIIETGRYFPPDWNYANNDLWVFYTQTFVLPLLLFMHNGFLAHAGSDLVSAALILHGTWLLTGLLEQSRLARLLGMLVLSAGMSLIMAEHIYGQAAYGSMYYMACYLICAYWHLIQARGGRRLLLSAAATVALTALVFWANPQRALLFYGLPLLCAGACQQWLEFQAARGERRPASRRQLLALALTVAGIALGVLLSKYTLQKVHNTAGLTAMQWLDFDHMSKQAAGVVAGVVGLFDGVPRANSTVVSLFGAYQMLRLVAAFVLLLMLPWALYKAVQPRRTSRQLVVVFAAVSLGLNLLIVLTTDLADMGYAPGGVRYLVPSLLIMLLILIGVVVDRRALPPLLRAAGLAGVLLLASSAPASYLYPYSSFLHLPRQGVMLQTPDQQLSHFLQQQGLRYGYASFWNAGKLSVLSSGALRVRQVSIERGLPQPVRKLSSNRWYQPSYWQGETFLMLRDDELQALNQPLLDSYAGAPRRLRFQDYTILVFPANLAASLPSWDLAVDNPVHYRIDAQSMHLIGRLEGGPEQPGALTAQPGESGALHFGPMRALNGGDYTVQFALDAGGDGVHDFGFVDIVDGGGVTILARRQLTDAGPQRIALRFRSDQPLSTVEFRVFSSGQGRLTLRGIDIARTPPNSIAAAPAAQEK
jgi:hypothetical protein